MSWEAKTHFPDLFWTGRSLAACARRSVFDSPRPYTSLRVPWLGSIGLGALREHLTDYQFLPYTFYLVLSSINLLPSTVYLIPYTFHFFAMHIMPYTFCHAYPGPSTLCIVEISSSFNGRRIRASCWSVTRRIQPHGC